MANGAIGGAAQAAARMIEQQAQAASPARVAESAKGAAQEAAKALDKGAEPIVDAMKATHKQAKAMARLSLEQPLLAPLIVPAIPLMAAAKGAVAVHKSHVAIAKQVINSHKEVAHAAQTLTTKEKIKIATNPGFVFLPPGIREMAIAGEIKRQAAKKAANND